MKCLYIKEEFAIKVCTRESICLHMSDVWHLLQTASLSVKTTPHQKQTLKYRSSPHRGVLMKRLRENSSKFTVELTLFLQSDFSETTLRHGCSPVNLLHI